VKVNHRCNFIHNPVLKYVGGDKNLLLDIDEDKWSFIELVDILKENVNCSGDFKLWWTWVHDVGLKKLALDSDALGLANFALSNNTEVLVYVEKINDGRVIVSKGDVVALDDTDKGVGNEFIGVEAIVSEFDSSDTESNEGGSESGYENDNEGVVFEDSEEERATRVNNGF